MTVEQAVEKLKEQNSYFDISIPLEAGKEKKLAELATLQSFGEEAFFKAFDSHQVNELNVTLRPKRGIVYNFGETFRVQKTPTLNKPKMSNLTNSGQPQAELWQYMMSAKDDKIQDQNRLITSLENAVKSSEKEILELKQKNMELERENKLKDAEFAIERKGWEANREREDFAKEKEGLNGIVAPVERLAANPAVLEMFKMFLASKATAQPAIAPHSEIMPKPHVAHLVKNFSDWMNQQDEKTANNFFNIVAQMSNHPETWPQVKQVIFPQQQAA